MAPTATVVNDLLNTLEEENLAALSAIQNIFAEDKGWGSEEEMLADMADFRRERLK